LASSAAHRLIIRMIAEGPATVADLLTALVDADLAATINAAKTTIGRTRRRTFAPLAVASLTCCAGDPAFVRQSPRLRPRHQNVKTTMTGSPEHQGTGTGRPQELVTRALQRARSFGYCSSTTFN